MKRKVCLVTSLHKVNDERIFEKECTSLAKKYDVYFVAPNTGKKEVNGVHIVGVELPDINHRFKRWTRLGKLIPVLREIDAEVYHFQDPELMSLGLKMKKGEKKVIFDSHEDVPAYLLSASFVPSFLRRLVSKCYAVYERQMLKEYDALVSVTPFIIERFKKINPNSYQITNYPKFFEKHIERKWERKVIFAGLIGKAWNLDKVISILSSINVELILCGHYATDEYLNYLKGLPGWEHVDYRGSVPHEKVLEYYGECCGGLAIETYEDANVGYREGSLGNTKRLDYMSVGIPLITSASNVWKNVVDTNQCGVCVNDPTDSKQIADAISRVVDNLEETKQMGDNAQKAVSNEYNWNTQEIELFRLYKNLLGE